MPCSIRWPARVDLKLVIVLLALGFPVACALAWAFDVTPQGIERTPRRDPCPVRRRGPAPPCRRGGRAVASPMPGPAVAILSFADLSPGRDQEYFCDGIAEEIVNALCCVSGLRIASRTSAAQFKAARRTSARSARRSASGGARRQRAQAGNRVRITAQLVNAAMATISGRELRRGLEDVFATQTEIAQKLVRALRLSLTPQEAGLLERGGTAVRRPMTCTCAARRCARRQRHDAAAGGGNVPQRAGSRSAVRAGARRARKCLAYAGIWGLDVDTAGIEEALAASRRALELEPRMPEAFVAKGNLLFMQGKAEQAFAAFEEAIRLNPSSYEATTSTRGLFSAGHAAQAVAYYEVASACGGGIPAAVHAGGRIVQLGRTEQARAAAPAGCTRSTPGCERSRRLARLHLGQCSRRGWASASARSNTFGTRSNCARRVCHATTWPVRTRARPAEEALDMLDGRETGRATGLDRARSGLRHAARRGTLRRDLGRLRAKGEGRRG